MNEQRVQYLIDNYTNQILRISYTWLNNTYDAEDICQNVIIKIIEKDLVFDDLGHEKAYIIRSTINACKNLKKSVWFKRVIPIDQSKEVSILMPEIYADSILEFVQKLPLKYRRVIYLYYYEDYSVTEIANILGEKPALISTHLIRAKSKLKLMLGENYNERPIQIRT